MTTTAPLTPAKLRKAIAVAEAVVEAAKAAEADFEARFAACETVDAEEAFSREHALAWEAAIDAVTAAESELRFVRLNLAPVLVGSTAWLAARNLD